MYGLDAQTPKRVLESARPCARGNEGLHGILIDQWHTDKHV